MANQFLDKTGLSVFLAQLKGLFATKADTAEVKANTDPYIFNIDYSVLEFDTTELVTPATDPAKSSKINTGKVGFMLIAKS